MNTENVMHDFTEKGATTGHLQLQNIFRKLIGKRIRFCLKNNNYDLIVLFEAMLAGFYPCKQLWKVGSLELTDWSYRLENDKGIEIHLPVRKLVRVDEPDNVHSNNYFLIFERHFWSFEVLSS